MPIDPARPGSKCVKIDVERLRARLSAEQGVELSMAQVEQWLRDQGFQLRGHWYCDGDELHHLRADEIVHTWTLQKEGHVTYVDSRPAPPGAPD